MQGTDTLLSQIYQLIEAWELFSTAVWSSVLAGVLLGLLGSYLVLRKMVFLNAAITQASTLGIVLAFVIHQAIPPLLLAPMVTMLCVWWIDQNDLKLNRENRIAVIFVICNAFAIVLHSMTTEDPNEIERLLMGSAVLVQEKDYQQLLWSTAIIGLWQFWWWRGFAKVSFDPISAQIQGLPFQLLNFILLLQIAWATSLGTQVIGSLPTFALSILPALVAKQLARNLVSILLISAMIGGISGGLGYLLAFFLQISVGPAQSLVAGLFLLMALLWRGLIKIKRVYWKKIAISMILMLLVACGAQANRVSDFNASTFDFTAHQKIMADQLASLKQKEAKSNEEIEQLLKTQTISAWYALLNEDFNRAELEFSQLSQQINRLKSQKTNQANKAQANKAQANKAQANKGNQSNKSNDHHHVKDQAFFQIFKTYEAFLILGQSQLLVHQLRLLEAMSHLKSLQATWAKNLAYVFLSKVISFYGEEWDEVTQFWHINRTQDFIKVIDCPLLPSALVRNEWGKSLSWRFCPTSLFSKTDFMDLSFFNANALQVWKTNPIKQSLVQKDLLYDGRGKLAWQHQDVIFSQAQVGEGIYLSYQEGLSIQQNLAQEMRPSLDDGILDFYFDRLIGLLVNEFDASAFETSESDSSSLNPSSKAESEALVDLEAQIEKTKKLPKKISFQHLISDDLEGAGLYEDALRVYENLKDQQKTPFILLKMAIFALALNDIEKFDLIFPKIKEKPQISNISGILQIARDDRMGMFKKEYDLLKLFDLATSKSVQSSESTQNAQNAQTNQAPQTQEEKDKVFCKILKHFIDYRSEAIRYISPDHLWRCRYFDLAYEKAIEQKNLSFIIAVFHGSFRYFNQHIRRNEYWIAYLNAIYQTNPRMFNFLLSRLPFFKGIDLISSIKPALTEQDQQTYLQSFGEYLKIYDELSLMTDIYQPQNQAYVKTHLDVIWFLLDFMPSPQDLQKVLSKIMSYAYLDPTILQYLIAHPQLLPYADLKPNVEAVLSEFKDWLAKASNDKKAYPYYKVLEHQRVMYQENGQMLNYTLQIFYFQHKDAIEKFGELKPAPSEKMIQIYTIKPDLKKKYPILIPEKEHYSLDDLQVGDFLYYESISDIKSNARIPRIVTSHLEVQDRYVPVFRFDDALVIPNGYSILMDEDLLKNTKLSNDQRCELISGSNQSSNRLLKLNLKPAKDFKQLSLSCLKNPNHQVFQLKGAHLMPDFDEPYQPTSIRQQMTLSLYEPTQFDRIWSMVHWQLENQIKSNRLFKEGILRGLPHQLTKIETEREKNPIIASQLEQENLAYLIDLSIEHIKDQVPPLEMTNLNLAQKQQKGNRSIYLSALLSIAQIEHEVYFASAAQVQKWFEPDLLTLDDYSYPLVRIQNQWYDLQMGKSLPNVLPMSLLGGKAVKIYAFRKEASDLTQAEFMEIEKIVENEYWMDLDFQILKNRKLQIKVQQRFQGEQAVYFDQKIKQDPNHQELRNLLSTDWNRWIGRHDLSQLKVTFEKGILTFNYHIQSKIEAPIRFPLNANQWQRKFASLKDRKHDLYLPKQTQHLRLKIACEDEGEIQKIKQAFEKRMNGNAQSWQHEKVRFLLKAGDLKAGDLKAGWMLEADWELKGGVVRAEDYAGWKNIIKQIDQEEYLDID